MSTLVLPSLNRFACIFWDVFCLYVGEIIPVRGEFVTLVLPLWNRNYQFHIRAIFVHFWVCHLLGPQVSMVIYHRGGWPHYMYIYSLRHFLTTKGALIDGDGYLPLPPLKWPQNDHFFDQFSLKFSVKNVSKNMILNGKSHFFTKINSIDIKITQKWWKINTKYASQNMIKFDYQKGG